jgi:2-haloacid dehalogenase
VLAKSYDELKRRLTGQGSAPDAGSSTIAEVQVSHGAAGGGVTEAGTSAAGSSSSASTSTSTSTSTTMASSSSSSAATTQSHSPEATEFAASIAHWQPFPDTVAALAKLSSLGLKLIVLSNVDRKSFAHTQKILEQGFTFSHIFTAEEIGTYKPNPNNHRHVLQQLATASGSESDSAFDPAQVLAVAQSLMHDHVPAQNLGLASAWINRSGAIMGLSGEGVPESEEAKRAFVQFTFETMAEFADAYAKAKGSL